MYRSRTAAVAAIVFLVCAGGALAGGPPIVNETTHLLDATSSDVGLNCATGNASERTITVTGVLRTLVFADGSYALHGSLRGDTVFDDIAPGATQGDGRPDATSHFRIQFVEKSVPSGNAISSEIFSGTVTALATNTVYRLHVTYKLMLDPAGMPRVEILRITCA